MRRAGNDMPEAARRLVAAISSRDIAAIESLYAPDFTAHYNFLPEPISRSDAVEMLSGMFGKVRSIEYRNVEASLLPEGFVLEFTLQILARNGRSFQSVNCIVASVDGQDRIMRLREYLDPSGIAALDADADDASANA